MKPKLTALLAGLALLGLAGAARADALAPATTQALTVPALTDTWSLPDTQPAKSAETQVVTLTDAQMDEVTAGYWWYYGYRTFGWRYSPGGTFYYTTAYLWIWY